jgi:hypothetical protein
VAAMRHHHPRHHLPDKVKLLHGRHVGPLLTMWAAALVFVAALYWLQETLPALDDLITPLYVVVVIILIWATTRWVRERSHVRAQRYGDRRHRDRRHLERRAPE